MPTAPRQTGQQLMNRIGGGMNAAGSPFGAISGFMGLPFFSRGSDRLGSYAGHGQMLSPFNNYGGRGGFGGGGGGGGNGGGGNPGTGGNDPGTGDPNTDAMLKAGLPKWWVEWLNKSGQYGVWNQPPGGGLLD